MTSSFSVRALLSTAVFFSLLLFVGVHSALAAPEIFLAVIDSNGESQSSAEILEGEQVTLAWIGQEITNCVITPGNIAANDTGPSSTYYDGQIVLTPTSNNMVYEINCQGATDFVNVTPPPVVTLSVDYPVVNLESDGSLTPGNPTITWNAEAVTTCDSIRRISPISSTPSGNSWGGSLATNFSGSRTDSSITSVGEYRYELTCYASDGRPVSAGVTVDALGTAQTPELIMTISPNPVTANASALGTVSINWSGVNLIQCMNIRHTNPVSGRIEYLSTGLGTSGSITKVLSEPGEHQFRLSCSRGDGGGEIVSTATVVLNYDVAALNAPMINLTANPSAITLTSVSGPQSSLLTWSSDAVAYCSDWLLRKAPSETVFRNFYNIGNRLSGSQLDYGITETGVYTYRLTCYAATDGNAITETAVINVDGDDLVPEINIMGVPDRVTPDPSTGLGSTTVVWSHPNYPALACGRINSQAPGSATRRQVTFDSVYNSSGSELIEDLNRYGIWTYDLRCNHPSTGVPETKLAYVRVDPVPLLAPTLLLDATQVDDGIEITYASEHYSSCGYVEKQTSGNPTWYSFSNVSANTSGVLTDNSTLISGTYSYRLTCSRPIEDRVDTIVTIVTFAEGAVSSVATVGFGECRNAAGDVVTTPDGYTVAGDGNCVLTGVLGDIILSFDSPLILAGDSAVISWEYTGTVEFDECRLQGPGLVDTATGIVMTDLPISVLPGVTGTAQTDPRYSTSLYSITCAKAGLPEPLASEVMRLQVVPTYQEI